MSLSTYKKRIGTSDRGKDYEWLLCSFYSLNFSISSDVVDFELYTNNEFFGDFDDIALRVKFSNGSIKVFLLQLKHSEKSKTLPINSLTSQNGDFTLLKYRKSYHNTLSSKNFHFILFVNKTANFKDPTKLTVEKEDILIRRHVCVGGGLLDTNKGKNCSVFKFETSESSSFFESFYLYANQQNDTHLKQSICDLLKSRLCCDIYTNFVEFMRSWWAGNFKLTKYDIIAKLAELVLSPMIRNLNDSESNERTELIRHSILKFDLTIVKESGKISKIWPAAITDMKRISLTALKFGLTTKGIGKMEELSDEKKSRVLWYLNEWPLLVEVDELKKEQIEAVLWLLTRSNRRRRLILLGSFTVNNWRTFRNLMDLQDHDFERFSNTFSVSLQGKKDIKLKEFCVNTLRSVFGVAQLLEIATQEGFNIGEPLETLPPFYIPRSFSKILLNSSVIDGLSKSKILLSCNGQFSSIQDKINKQPVEISIPTRRRNFFKYAIFVTDSEFSEDVVTKELTTECPSHHFRINGQSLQWLTSKGKIEELEPFRKDSEEVINERDVDEHFRNKVRVLTSHTGTGKTTFFNHLKNTARSDWFVLKMNLKDYEQCDQQSKIWDYIVDFSTKKLGYNQFESEFLRKFDKNRVMILWDALEELDIEFLEAFLDTVKSLRDLGVTQWISAQNRFRKFLEVKLGVFAMTLLPLSQNQQIEYMQKRCGVTMTRFFDTMRVVDNQEYLGVPLQLYILTDIFSKDPQLLDNIFTLTDMFTAFIEGKYKHHLMRNDGFLRPFLNLIEDAKTHRMDQYKIAGMKTYLPILHQKLCLKNTDKFLESVKTGDFLGLIEELDDDGNFKFEYQILGEFLTASFLAEVLPRGLEDYIFEEKCRNIRFMFDLLVSANEKNFLGVLYKKFDDVGGGVKDRHGRTPLHVVCSYGRRHPKLGAEQRGLLVTDGAQAAQEDDPEVKATIRRLVKIYNPNERDELFGWSCYDYADRSLSLGLLECLNGEVKDILPKLHNYSLPVVLYYSIRMNYVTLFNSIQHLPYVEDTSGCNLIHVATEFNREDSLTRLLSQDTYKVSINKSNKDNWTPLHIATFNGNFTLIKFLLKKGATFMLREPSLMSLAVVKGRKDLVEFFLKCGCSPNEFYHTNHFTTSIFQAIDRKHDAIVNLLMRNGAKLYCVNRATSEDDKPNPFGMNLFHMLLENEQFEEADEVLKMGIHINSVDNEGQTAFHHAAINNQESVLRYLLAKGGDHKLPDNNGKNPLHAAAHSGSIAVAKILISLGIDTNHQDKEGLTPLHRAVLAGKTKFVSFLITTGVDPNIGNKFGRTPLHMAAIYDLEGCIKILCQNGADLEAKDRLYDRTPLHLAAWNGNDACVRYLLEEGAQIDRVCRYGFTALHLAIEASYSQCCLVLLQAGASVHVVNTNGVTPLNLLKRGYVSLGRLLIPYDPAALHSAVSRGDVVFIEELLLADFDVNGADGDGDTPLHVAVRGKEASLVKMLLTKGADVKRKNHKGFTPLHCAIQSDYRVEEIIHLVLNEDIVNDATTTGDTPLILACQIEWLELVGLLLTNGGNTDSRDNIGLTPLHYAASVGNTDIVTLLLKKDTNVNRGTNTGRTSLHLAASRGHLNVVRLLLALTTTMVIDSYGDSPIDDALKAEHPAIFELLLNHNREYDVTKKYLGRTVLHAAAKHGSLDLVKFFMKKIKVDGEVVEEALFNRHWEVFDFLTGLVSFDVNKFSDRYGKYPLHVVTCAGSFRLVELFLKKGARVDVVDDEGNTPIHNAVECPNLDIFFKLVHSGSQAVNMQNLKGQTALHLVVKTLNASLIDYLLGKGADPDITDQEGSTPLDFLLKERDSFYQPLLFKMKSLDVDKKSGRYQKTLLHVAVEAKSLESIKWLLQRDASVHSEDVDGDTPLHYAAQGTTNILRLLLEKYTDIDKQNKEGETILHIAAMTSIENVMEILKHNPSLYSTTKYGATPLFYALRNPKYFILLWQKTPEVKVFNMTGHMTKTLLHKAAHEGDLESVKFLLDVGLKINEADNNGETPLKQAAQNRHLDVLRVLLQQDGEHTIVNICNGHGQSLLHCAAMNGHLEAVKLLVRCHARTDLCDKRGWTAAKYASEGNFTEIHRFLTRNEGKNWRSIFWP